MFECMVESLRAWPWGYTQSHTPSSFFPTYGLQDCEHVSPLSSRKPKTCLHIVMPDSFRFRELYGCNPHRPDFIFIYYFWRLLIICRQAGRVYKLITCITVKWIFPAAIISSGQIESIFPGFRVVDRSDSISSSWTQIGQVAVQTCGWKKGWILGWPPLARVIGPKKSPVVATIGLDGHEDLWKVDD